MCDKKNDNKKNHKERKMHNKRELRIDYRMTAFRTCSSACVFTSEVSPMIYCKARAFILTRILFTWRLKTRKQYGDPFLPSNYHLKKRIPTWIVKHLSA